METLWFVLVAFMLSMYVVLDGFDLGVGILHRLVARNEDERRLVLSTIGPVWDGNEVWLLAAGGTLYFAFPRLYASSFSGFYLPLMIVLWLLMLRGLGIELRHHLHHPMWRSFWDTVFSMASLLLAVFFGAALGNVVRGVPLRPDGFFFEPLWTNFMVDADAGVLDWFTTLLGVVAVVTLTVHGANFLAMKTVGEVQQRCRLIGLRVWWLILVVNVAAMASTFAIRPEILNNFLLYRWGLIFPAFGIVGLIGMLYYRLKVNDERAFVASSVYVASMMATTAFGLYPNVLPASTDESYNLTVYNTVTHPYGLSVGLTWWIVGMVLAAGYFVFVYRSFWGKVTLQEHGEGY